MDAIITLEAESKVEKQKRLEAKKHDELEAIYGVHIYNNRKHIY